MLRSIHVHAAFPRAVPFALFIGFLVLRGEVSGFDTRWLYPVQVSVVALALVVFWPRYDELRCAPPARLGSWLLAVGVGTAVFVAWINLYRGWAVVGDPGPGFDPRDDGQINVFLLASRLSGAALVVPVMEELFWRSLVMRWIDRQAFLAVDPRAVSARAVLVNSAVFAVEHHQWFAGFLAGVGYAWVYRASGNLWMPVLAHAVTNGLLGAWVTLTRSWHFW